MIRHAVVHPRPMHREVSEPSGTRELVAWNVSLDFAADLSDDAVAVALRIEDSVGHMFGSLERWVAPRGSDGRFPDSHIYGHELDAEEASD